MKQPPNLTKCVRCGAPVAAHRIAKTQSNNIIQLHACRLTQGQAIAIINAEPQFTANGQPIDAA